MTAREAAEKAVQMAAIRFSSGNSYMVQDILALAQAATALAIVERTEFEQEKHAALLNSGNK